MAAIFGPRGPIIQSRGATFKGGTVHGVTNPLRADIFDPMHSDLGNGQGVMNWLFDAEGT